MTQNINLLICIHLAVSVSDSESSVKWNVMNKSIKIGDEAILNCSVHTCSPTMRKTWFGGRNYQLLCYDDISTNPDKYEMISFATSFNTSLIIKHFNFTDINCVYTCACGFNRYTHMLKLDDLDFVYGDFRDSSKLKDNRFIVDVDLKVYPIPKCSIVYKEKEYKTSLNIVDSDPSSGNISTLYSVTIKDALKVDERDSKLLISITCKIGPSKHHLNAFEWKINTNKVLGDKKGQRVNEFGNDSILKITLMTVGIVIVIVIVLIVLIMLIKRKCKKTNDTTEYRNGKHSATEINETMLKVKLQNDSTNKSMPHNNATYKSMPKCIDTYKSMPKYIDTYT